MACLDLNQLRRTRARLPILRDERTAPGGPASAIESLRERRVRALD